MKSIYYLLLIYFVSPLSLQAQPVKQLNSAEILLGLEKLNTVGSVLYVAAHPDDENTRLLAYLSSERKFRTGYLSVTRGDGGQNLIGKEQGEPLGLIRTQELLAARRTDGAEQFFTRANDFGYSKNPEETFGFWNKDSILADVVWTIRVFKPDVIICRFPTTGEGGHGHHTASAILAEEAYTAASDPKRFPEQLAYTQVWQVKRLFWNTFNFGGTNTTNANQLKIDVGVYNPLLGKSYGEIAAESRSNHKSQGFGSAAGRGSSIEYFKQLKGDSVSTDLFEGINTTWSRFAGTGVLQNAINICLKSYSSVQPEKIVDDLLDAYKQLQKLDGNIDSINYYKQQKLKEATALILACSGLWFEASVNDYYSIPGGKVLINAQAINRSSTSVKLNGIKFLNQTDTVTNLELKNNELYSFKHEELLPASLEYSSPYWLNEKHTTGSFTIKNQMLIGNPENISQTVVLFSIAVIGVPFQITRPLIYKATDPVKGEVYRPFEVLPPATISISEKVFVYNDAISKTVFFTVKANANGIKGTLQVTVPEGWTVDIKNPDFNIVNKNEEAIVEAIVTPLKNALNGKLTATVKIDDKIYSASIQRIGYDHIPYQFILRDADAKLITLDLKKTTTNIGYIPGAGDDVAACLSQVGYNVTQLTNELLANENLSKYSAIITGVRAYNTDDKLQLYYPKLMEYVKNGGNFIVQYNTNNRIGPVKAKIGPYPFTISRDRVTDETAEVRFIDPESAVLNSPNKITEKDFDGWIQERGIYFATELDSNYTKIFSINDPNEKASEGSLITAKYGKGNFAYTGLVFFRELPAGAPGAYRLFVNLISMPANK